MYGLLSSENEKKKCYINEDTIVESFRFSYVNVLKTIMIICCVEEYKYLMVFLFMVTILLFGTLVLFFLIHLFATSNIADVVSNIQNLNEKFVVPVTAAEFQVMRTAFSVCCYLIFINWLVLIVG